MHRESADTAGAKMPESHDPVVEAVEALRSSDCIIEPDVKFERWQVDGKWITSGDLMTLALRLGLMEGPVRLQ
ncbi:hypothetical protein [Methylobacterium brachiatum]|uniref:hypothetical protein n=1 Tax=Methylobacterium brachiatum TaxID=269660 RepID=UPI0008EF10D2|nr:hypothetical protein [Methylobacterium brachiatum]SFI20060.1 hypothetical protein SAMN02799642_01166 [Methylobacterium brachiatum]